jgi:hypothetical protein
MQRKFLTLKKPAASGTLILIDNCVYLSVEKKIRGSVTSISKHGTYPISSCVTYPIW